MPKLTNVDEWWAEYARIKSDIQSWSWPNVAVKNFTIARIPYQKIRSLFIENLETPFWDLMDQLEQKRDPIVWLILQIVWEDAPNSPQIHSWANWHPFCDLCSEGPECLNINGGDEMRIPRPPNLQQIPINSEEFKKVKEAALEEFKAKIEKVDYSKIELRVVAHMKGNPDESSNLPD